MRVQLDRLEDNGMAVLLLFPHGRESFDVPPEDARVGEVFEVSSVCDPETDRMAAENKRLLDELLGRDG